MLRKNIMRRKKNWSGRTFGSRYGSDPYETKGVRLSSDRLNQALANPARGSETRVSVRDFPGGPVAKTLHFYCRGLRFDLWLGN